MIKAIFIDLDGTLLNSQREVTEYTDIERISTFNEITFKQSTDSAVQGIYTYIDGTNESNSKILDNESILLYSPSLRDVISYETTIKYIYPVFWPSPSY